MSSKATRTACLYRRHGFYTRQMILSCIVNKQSFRTQHPTTKLQSTAHGYIQFICLFSSKKNVKRDYNLHKILRMY